MFDAMRAARTVQRRAWIYPMLLLGGTALAWFAVLLLLQRLLSAPGEAAFWHAISSYRTEDVQAALGNLPEVVVAILGIAITVVSIIVQLSATRYTPRVTEMFFRDRTNLLVLGFFVVTSIHCIWATFIVHGSFTPHILIATTVAMMTGAILVLIPYFVYVFAFLDPERVVARLQDQAFDEAVVPRTGVLVETRQRGVLEGIEQLADVAVNSVSNKDRIIAARSVDALRDLATSYVESKQDLPDDWFKIGPALRQNPDFTVMAEQKIAEHTAGRTWLEFKVLRQYQTIFNESLNRMRDISQLVAIDTRYIGEAAIAQRDQQVVRLTVKFFNTYIRSTINARDVRSAYNVLHQYRQLSEMVLRTGWDQLAGELATYFKYYGQTANAVGLAFVTETAAYDLCRLCEVAHEVKSTEEAVLLGTFLDVDKIPETEAEERSLRGVRKAQIKLATYYLHEGAEDQARRIWADMEHERPERLVSIREELLAVENEDFWEIIDRGHNFDYLEPARRDQLHRFYSWFPGTLVPETTGGSVPGSADS